MDIRDITTLIYLTTGIAALYGAGLFIWWWGKQGSASSVFAYVTAIFLGEVFESAMSIYARSLVLVKDFEAYSQFVQSWMWPGRKIITLLALSAMAMHMTLRAFHRRDRRDNGKS